MAHYEPIIRWSIPRGVALATLRGIRRASRERHEGGAFWLGNRTTVGHVRTVVLLQGTGVVEERGFWEVSPLVFGVVGEWATAREQVLLAVVHSHEGSRATWLSPLDQRGGVHVPDMLALIMPGFGSVRDSRQWGMHRFDGAGFTELGPAEREARIEWTEDDFVVVRASEGGIIDV